MSKYSDFINKQEEFIVEIENSRNGINHQLYSELVRLDRVSLSNMTFQQEIKKYEENGKEYNLYNEQGFAYKYTFVYLCDFLLKNGFQLPESILNSYNEFTNETTIYQQLLSSKGDFEFSTIKYILSIDLGLREQMKNIFGVEIINESIFPKFENTKQNLETIRAILKETKKRHQVANFTTDQLKSNYITAMQQRINELEIQIISMKEKIEKEGIFTLENHPQYKVFLQEYNALNKRISELHSMNDPQEIEQLRNKLLGKIVDYKTQYENLKEGKNIKGDKDTQTLESEKEFYEQKVQSFSSGGNLYKSVKQDMLDLNSNMIKYSDDKLVFADLKDLLKKYEDQNQKCANASIEKQNKENELNSIQQEYDETTKEYLKMMFIQKHTQKGKENESRRLDLRKQEKVKKEELIQSQATVGLENANLDSVKQEVLKKIEQLQKNDAYKKYFQIDTPERPIPFQTRMEELKICINELNRSLVDLDVQISDTRTKIAETIEIPETSITNQNVDNRMAQIVVEGERKVQDFEKALNYATIQETQPSYYENLEIGVELAEEEISHIRK